jgi:uncharacterized delta-60 repeat protein
MKPIILKFVIPVLIFIISPCYSQSVQLDRDFDGDGIVINQLGDRDDEAKALAIQADGKILVAGYTETDMGHDGVVIRYNTDGSLDNTFNGTGILIIDIGGGSNFFEAIALQEDGKIIAAGRAYYTLQTDIVMIRLNSDGTLDNTFGDAGIVHTNLHADDYAYSVLVLEDGKIIVGGISSTAASGQDVAILRYNSDGTLDPTFSSDGKVVTCIGESDDRCRTLLIQPDGKIVAAGFYDNSDANDDFALVRYNTDGTLDHSFGEDGIITTPIGESHDQCYSAVLQPDGKIVLAGNSNDGSGANIAVVRYDSDGTLDASFSVDGKVTTAIGEYSSGANSVQLQPDGKIIVAGWTYNGTDRDYVLVRYNSDGTLDHSFDEDGKFILPIGDGDDSGNAMVLQADHRIVVAGFTEMGSDLDLSLIRLLNELNLGTIDFSSVGNDILVYPNPVSDYATIEFNLALDEIISMVLYDMQGKLIQTFIDKGRKPAGKHEESLSFDSSVPPGMYSLVISNDIGKQSILIIKN